MILHAEFFNAKNGSLCAKANGVLLHSKYDPQKEAERFAQNAEASFVPKNVVVVEGALGYAAHPLKKKFPQAKIATIRLCKDFSRFDCEWDFVFFSDENEKRGLLCETLYNAFGEEGIFQTLFLEWKESRTAFFSQAKFAWSEIKAAIKKAQAVLLTREHFEKKWLKNKARFFCSIKNAARLKRIFAPVVICASGPSLFAALPFIKKNRERIFLVALSSSLAVLLANGICADLCFSTDGGYWAKRHFDAIRFWSEAWSQKKAAAAVALSCEGECPFWIFDSESILPLFYDDDFFSKEIFSKTKIPFMNARRNGTVSGTAFEFFLQVFCGTIFFAGLDLKNGKTFSHTQPNMLECENEVRDFRLFPKATRIAKSALPSESLEIYREWFKNFFWKDEKKVFRIIEKNCEKNASEKLGKIEDVFLEEADEILQNECQFKKAEKNFFEFFKVDFLQKSSIIKNAILDFSKTKEFEKEIFPLKTILKKRSKSQEEKNRIQNEIQNEKQKLISDILKRWP